jgi:hypothetical protein
MDGLPGLRRGVDTAKRENVAPMKKMVGPYAPKITKVNEKFELNNQLILGVILAILTAIAGVCIAAIEMGWVGMEVDVVGGSGNETGSVVV